MLVLIRRTYNRITWPLEGAQDDSRCPLRSGFCCLLKALEDSAFIPLFYLYDDRYSEGKPKRLKCSEEEPEQGGTAELELTGLASWVRG